MHFLHGLRPSGVSEATFCLYCRAAIDSVIQYGIALWYGNIPVQAKARLLRLVKTSSKLLGNQKLSSLKEIFHSSVRKLSLHISTDSTHVFHSQYELLPSGRRYRVHKCRTNRYKHSFVPNSVQQMNKSRHAVSCTV